MKYRTATFSFALLVISALSLQIDFAQSLTQPTETSANKKFGMLQYLRKEHCHPVEVKAISVGTVPPEVYTSLISIKSFSDKPVTAVKVRWDVYKFAIGMKKRVAACDAASEPAEIFLSGTTPFIDVGRLLKGEIYNLSSDPLLVKTAHPANKVILVERPIIAWDELMSLSIDGSRGNMKDDYIGLVYVGEIHFEDGTRWEAEMKY